MRKLIFSSALFIVSMSLGILFLSGQIRPAGAPSNSNALLANPLLIFSSPRLLLSLFENKKASAGTSLTATPCAGRPGSAYPQEGSGNCRGNLQLVATLPTLPFSFVYNSQSATDWGYGVGWDITVDANFIRTSATTATLYLGDGTPIAFIPSTTNSTWVAQYPVLTDDSITIGNGTLVQLHRDGTSDIYTQVTPTGSSPTYARTASVDRSGQPFYTISRNASGMITAIVDRFNKTSTFSYSGNVLTLTDFNNGQYVVAYNGDHNLTRISYPDGSTFIANYGSPSVAGTAYPMTSASSNNFLTGWPATNAIDGNGSTSYSSNFFPTAANVANGANPVAYLAAWTGSMVSASQLILTARMGTTGPTAFPVSYEVYITNPLNSAWIDLGTFTTQPINGVAVISLGASYQTWGVLLTPVTLGVDGYQNHYFQMAEVQLANPRSLISSTTNRVGQTTTFTYNSNANQNAVAAVTDWQGYTTNYTYSSTNVTVTSFSQNLNETFPSGSTGAVTRNSTINGMTATSVYDSAYRLTQTTDIYGNQTGFTYVGNTPYPWVVTNPDGSTVTYGYDTRNFVNSVTAANARRTTSIVTTLVNNAFGDVLTSTTNNFTTTNAYDSKGNPISSTNNAGTSFTASYYTNSLVKTSTDSSQYPYAFNYDTNGNLANASYPTGENLAVRSNPFGAVLSASSSLGGNVQNSFDSVGRPVSSVASSSVSSSPVMTTAPVISTTTNAYSPTGVVTTTSMSSLGTSSGTYPLNGSETVTSVLGNTLSSQEIALNITASSGSNSGFIVNGTQVQPSPPPGASPRPTNDAVCPKAYVGYAGQLISGDNTDSTAWAIVFQNGQGTTVSTFTGSSAGTFTCTYCGKPISMTLTNGALGYYTAVANIGGGANVSVPANSNFLGANSCLVPINSCAYENLFSCPTCGVLSVSWAGANYYQYEQYWNVSFGGSVVYTVSAANPSYQTTYLGHTISVTQAAANNGYITVNVTVDGVTTPLGYSAFGQYTAQNVYAGTYTQQLCQGISSGPTPTPSSTLTGTLQPPLGLALFSNASNQMTASWESAGGTTVSFNVYTSTGNTPPACTGTPFYSGTNTSVNYNNSAAGQRLNVTVCAMDASGNLSGPVSASAQMPSSLPAPTDLVVWEDANQKFNATWNSGGGGTTGYWIAMSGTSTPPTCNGGNGISGIRWPMATPFTNTSTFAPGTTLSISVCAYNSAGVLSPQVSGTLTLLFNPPPPLGFYLAADSSNELTASWMSGGGSTNGFYLATNSGTSAVACNASGSTLYPASTTSVNLSGFAPGQTITVSICSVDTAGNLSTVSTAVAQALVSSASTYALYQMNSAWSPDVLSSGPASNAVDGKTSTGYSSTNSTTATNTKGSSTSLAAWMASMQTVSQVILTPYIGSNGLPVGFPITYQIQVTNPQNTAWITAGTFTTQPNANGIAVVSLGAIYQTWGVWLTPITFGTDSHGNYNFQMAEVNLAYATPFKMASAWSPNVLPTSNNAWVAANAIDGNTSTSYSSNFFPTAANVANGANPVASLATWTGSMVSASQLILTARMGSTGPTAFPVSYDVQITNPLNSVWIDLGTFTTQPINGVAVIPLGATYQTWGVWLTPITLGADSYQNHYFQMAEVQLAP